MLFIIMLLNVANTAEEIRDGIILEWLIKPPTISVVFLQERILADVRLTVKNLESSLV